MRARQTLLAVLVLAFLMFPGAYGQGPDADEGDGVAYVSMYFYGDGVQPGRAGRMEAFQPFNTSARSAQFPVSGLPASNVLVGEWNSKPLKTDIPFDGDFSCELWLEGSGKGVSLLVELLYNDNILVRLPTEKLDTLNGRVAVEANATVHPPSIKLREGGTLRIRLYYSAELLSYANVLYESKLYPTRITLPSANVDIGFQGLDVDHGNRTLSLNATVESAFGPRTIDDVWVEIFDPEHNFTIFEVHDLEPDNGTLLWNWSYGTFLGAGRDYEIRVHAEDGMGRTWSNATAFSIPAETPPAFLETTAGVAVAGATGLGGLGLLGVAATEWGRYRFLLLGIPLFTRLKKLDILNQPTRFKIHGYVIGNPGANFALIKQELGLTNGQLAYHLQVLEKSGEIFSRTEGKYRRFYPRDRPVPKNHPMLLSEVQQKILEVVRMHGGIGQKDIAALTGVSRQVASYHLMKLASAGLVTVERPGRRAMYYPSTA